MQPTITDQQIFERDWLNSPEALVILRREDGSIAIHQWGLTDDQACVLAMQAFQYNIAPLFRTGHSLATTTYPPKKLPEDESATHPTQTNEGR